MKVSSVVIFFLFFLCMPARKRPAAVAVGDLYQDLVQHGTKEGVTQTLLILQRRGLLAEGAFRTTHRSVRGDLGEAQKHHANAMTPYGRVVQRLATPIPQHPNWNIVHPLAILHYLSGLS